MATISNTSYEVRPDRHSLEEINSLNPENGVVVFDTDNGLNRYWNGSEWVFVSNPNGSLDSLQFRLDAGISASEGQLAWNDAEGTLDLGMKGGNVTQQVGQEMFFHVKAGEDLVDGDVVYASGAVGNSGQIVVSKFLADGNTKAFLILGVATESILSGEFGFITEFVDMLLTRDGVVNAEDANITPNVSETDICSAWSSNHGIHNTFVGAAQDITVEVQTVIATQNVAVPLLGTFVASDLQHFDAPSNGKLRFLGTAPIEYSVSWDFILDGTSNNEYRIELVRTRDSVETVIYGQTRVINALQGGRDVAYYSGSHHERILQNDTTHWTVKNLSGTGNCTLELDSDWTIDHR